MTEEAKTSVPMDGRVVARKTFYMVLPSINEDGTVNPTESVHATHTDIPAAEADAKEQVELGDDDLFIYECRPIRRVMRGQVRVLPLMKPVTK